ncbi:MAG: glycosyltransferase [Bacilli bacterium]|nr:glycosyltransferase [Bacilli bacterium]
MKVVFFSHIYSENGLAKYLQSKGKKLPGVAISNYEEGFINSIKLMNGVELIQINREFFPYCQNLDSDSLSSINKNDIILCSHKYQNRFFYKTITKDNEKNKIIKSADLFVFSTYHDWRLFKYVKKLNKNAKSILILPDLPNLVINKSSFKHKIARKLLSINFFKKCKYVDGLIPITDHLGEYMNKYIKNSLTIEGVVKDIDINKQSRDGYKNSIIYSGGLSRKYGIIDLIESFKDAGLSNEYKLIICGKGECEKEVIDYSNNDESIEYLGFIPRNKVLSLLSNSAYLVLPENPNNEYAKYSFHSKIIEYLASGTPVIGYMYPGIPNQYCDFILQINGGGKDIKKELTNALKQYTSMNKKENIDFGNRAKEFIINRISEKAIAQKIKGFIKTL